MTTIWQPTRRGFLGAVGAGTLALACGDDHDGGRFAGFTLGVQSWTFRTFALADTLRMSAALGFGRIELTQYAPGHLPVPASSDEIEALRAQLTGHGLACLTAHMVPAAPGHAANRAMFEYARQLGVRTLMLEVPPEERDSFEELAIELDVRVGIHNHTMSSFERVEDVLAALDGRDRRFGTIVDTGHYTRLGIDPIAALHAFEGRVLGVHLKDVAGANPAAPDTILGEGVLDLVGVLRALREIRFPADATLSVEYEANPEDPYDDLVVALDNIAAAAHASA